MSDEIILLPRDVLYAIFQQSYKKIAKDIEAYFEDEKITDKENGFKKLITNSIDEIHKRILTESNDLARELESIQENKEEEQEEYEEQNQRRGFWD